jgi:glycosyltransferase involved in cell wall biosynthesis
MQFDFTGVAPDPAENDLQLDRLTVARCNFLGRVEAFRELVLGYDLVINPSRMETFGMAAIEVLAAGVPLLSSRTGVIEEVLGVAPMLFPAGQPTALASAFEHIFENWAKIEFGVADAQAKIREGFLVDRSAELLDSVYHKLTAAPR